MRFFVLVLAPSLVSAQGPLTGSPVTGNVRPTSLRSEAEATNVLLGSISASAAVDDNNNNSATDPIVGEQYFLAPSLAIQQTHSHLKWNMSYRPGLRIYVPRSSLPDQFSQLFGGTLRYDVTRRLSIGVRQDYLRTTDPFERLGQAPLQPDIGLLDHPATVALPNVRRTSLLSGMEIDYRMAKHTYLGLAGNFTQLHYDSLGAKSNRLINTRDTSGSAFLTHQFTARQSAGIQYQFMNIVFPQGDSRTTTHGVLLFDQIAITPHMSFSIFAGPEYSRIHNQELISLLGFVIHVPMSKTLWSPAAGATFNWSGDRLGLQTSFVRQVSDGGGLLGSAEMTNAMLRIKRELARRWVVHLDGEMTHQALLRVSGGVKTQTLGLGAGISHELAHNMQIQLSYRRLHRTGAYLSTLPFGNHNRVTLALERNFSLPLGR